MLFSGAQHAGQEISFRIVFLKLQIVFPDICLHKRILIGRSAQRSMAYKQVFRLMILRTVNGI